MQQSHDPTLHLRSITGLRFVASFLVLICHIGFFYLPQTESNPVTMLVYAAGSLSLSFFFLISGFILTWIARPIESALAFWRRRLVKIMPNHLVTLAAAVVLMVGAGVAVTVTNTVPALFLLQGWFPSQEVVFNFFSNDPTWSLSCEVLFYLSFPWLLRLVRRIRPEWLWACLGVLVAIVMVVPLLARLLPDDEIALGNLEPFLHVWAVNFFPLSRVLEFMIGILVAQIVVSGKWVRVGLIPASVLVVIGCVLMPVVPAGYSFVAATVVPLALLIGESATADIKGRRTAFNGRVMVWLGEISFALFIVHWLVVVYGPMRAVDQASMVRTPGGMVFGAVSTIALSILLAWLLTVLVERPAVRRWSRPRRQTVKPDPAAVAPS
jgi:mycarose O-acyltransferase